MPLLLGLWLLASSCGEDIPEPGDVARGLKVAKLKCTFCHYVENSGGMIAPPIDKAIAMADAQLRDYEKRVADLKLAFPKSYAKEQAAIEAVLAQKDPTRRFEVWAGEYLRSTTFDNPMTKMGAVPLSLQQRADVVAWMLSRRPAR